MKFTCSLLIIGLFISCSEKCTEGIIQNNVNEDLDVTFYKNGESIILLTLKANSNQLLYNICGGDYTFLAYEHNDSVVFSSMNKTVTYYSAPRTYNVTHISELPCKNFFNYDCWDKRVKGSPKYEKRYIFKIDESDLLQN